MSSKKILIIKHGAFGDLIQADGVLHDLRAHFDSDELTLLTSSVYLNLMQRCPHLDRVLIDNREPLWKLHKQWQLFRTLQKEQFDLVIDLQISDRTRLYKKLFFSNVKWIGRPASEPRPDSAPRGHAKLLEQNNIHSHFTMHPDVSWMADNVDELLSSYKVMQPYVVLIPGSSAKHKNKRWPYYSELASHLINKGYGVVCLTGPDEQDLVEKIPGHHMRPDGQLLSWFQIAGLLKNAVFVVGNDTGPSHIASCLKKHGIALFGPTSVTRAEITRPPFIGVQAQDLSTLKLEDVLIEVEKQWPRDIAITE